MLQRNAISAHIGIKGIMNTILPTDLEKRGIRIPLEEASWLPPAGGKRRAYLNIFSAAGGNIGLLLKDTAKSTSISDNEPRTTLIISITAKWVWSLEKIIQKLLFYLETKPETSWLRLFYTTTARRTQHFYRVSFAISSISEAAEASRSVQAKIIKSVDAKPPSVVFVSTCQDAHYPSLGKQLFESSRQFRTDII